MNTTDLVQNMLAAISNNSENIAGYLADDLTFRTSVVAAGKTEFLKMLDRLCRIQPPIEWFLISMTEEADRVTVVLEPASEAMGTLLKPGMKLDRTSDANKSSELSKWVFAANKDTITSIIIRAAPGSLLAGMLKQLGLD
jgi:hypothetical protein